MIEQFFDLSDELLRYDAQALALCEEPFARLEKIKEYNQLKMLRAFTDSHVGAEHLLGSTGYGNTDPGRDKLAQVFARAVGAEAALMRQSFMSGTHTLTVALFGVLRPGDRMVAAAGRPYDTLLGVIGLTGDKGYGSLLEWGVQYDEAPLKDGRPDLALIAEKCKGAKMCYIQRSRGYSSREALSLADIEAISRAAKARSLSLTRCTSAPTGEDESAQSTAPRVWLSEKHSPGSPGKKGFPRASRPVSGRLRRPQSRLSAHSSSDQAAAPASPRPLPGSSQRPAGAISVSAK